MRSKFLGQVVDLLDWAVHGLGVVPEVGEEASVAAVEGRSQRSGHEKIREDRLEVRHSADKQAQCDVERNPQGMGTEC